MKPHVLVIDDDASQRAAYKRVLRRSDYRVTCAASGRDGLQALIEEVPDIVLLDVAMPVMSGHEFLRRVKQLERRVNPRCEDQRSTYQAPPIIFVSARTRLHEKVDGLDAGASDYITKPYDADDLRARIRRILRDQRQQNALRVCESGQSEEQHDSGWESRLTLPWHCDSQADA